MAGSGVGAFMSRMRFNIYDTGDEQEKSDDVYLKHHSCRNSAVSSDKLGIIELNNLHAAADSLMSHARRVCPKKTCVPLNHYAYCIQTTN